MYIVRSNIAAIVQPFSERSSIRLMIDLMNVYIRKFLPFHNCTHLIPLYVICHAPAS